MPLGSLPPGTDYAECARGGDLTWHGPGQLVAYPIFKIRDLGAHLRGLEGALIAVLAELGVRGFAREGAAGVWVEAEGTQRKIASLGVAVRKWVTYHGIALNVVNDSRGFGAISPCGFAPEVMTRLADLVPEAAAGDWRPRIEARLSGALARFPAGERR
jgi:lipoate-protein ligase B